VLKIKIHKLQLNNPILTASGTFGYADEFKKMLDLEKVGGAVLKGLTMNPKKGNPPPRIAETPCGMLNSVGLQNVGVHDFIKKKLPLLKNIKLPLIANVAGESEEENSKIVRALENAEQIKAIELNVSCPNVKQGGMIFGTNPKLLSRLVKVVRNNTTKTLIVKLSPNVTDITEMAKIAESEGADVISAINTLLGMAIDINKRKPVLSNVFGGLSGPAVKPVGLRVIWQLYESVKIPLIGIGGILTYKDVLEYIFAGASAVQVGTANFVNTRAAEKIATDLENYCKKNNISNIKNLIGVAH